MHPNKEAVLEGMGPPRRSLLLPNYSKISPESKLQSVVAPDKYATVLERLRDEGTGALTWWMTGITTYLFLYVCGRALLHEQAALDGLRAQVPTYIYDRSTFIFVTALCLDVLNMVFERHTTKIDFVMYPAFIKGMASTTNLLARFGTPIVAFSTTGRFLVVQRYICWMHTTPTILLVVRLISTSITMQEMVHAILWDELMLVTGAAALLTTGWLQVLFGIITHVALVPIIPYFIKGFQEAATSLRTGTAQGMMWAILGVNMAMWTLFAVTWNLALCDLISVQTEETMFLVCDFSAKVLFSSTLMLSSFKGMEARRETAMRNIEDCSKQKLIEELKRLLEQKERFMSSVSHELRTPLNGIIGISEGMLSNCCGVMPEQVRQQICIIRTSGARLLALINDVMDAAALRQNKLVLKQEVVVLRHVVEDVLDLTRSLVNSSAVELRNTVSPRITVLGDAGRIVQILNNLLGNAAKFTKRGMIKVSARTFDGGQRVAVMVQDTGIGIPRAKLATIFLPFEQVDMSVSRKFGGFGLGLNIVQDLVKAHGGEIWAESTEDKGSTFTFTMVSGQGKLVQSLYGEDTAAAPAQVTSTASQGGDSAFEVHRVIAKKPKKAKGDLVRVRGLLHETSSEAQTSEAQTSSGVTSTDSNPMLDLTMQQPKKLANIQDAGEDVANRSLADETWNPDGSLSPANSGPIKRARVFHHQYCGRYQVMSVDDDPINQNVVCSIFNSSGFEVLPFSGGEEALHHLATCMVLPDLVLLDCMMPAMDGFEVLRRLRAMSQSMHLPVIMVSARAEEENIVMGLSNGADDYVTKPFRRAELLARARCQLGSTASSENGGVSMSSNESGSSTALTASSKASRLGRGSEVLVLCVDDDQVSQQIISQLLQPENWRLVAMKSSKDAKEYITQNRRQLPDLVLLDASLPDGSGFDLCKELRARYSRNKLPIIILSAYHNEESIVEGLSTGANDYVSKPFKRQELLARMRMHLRHFSPNGGSGQPRNKELEAAVLEAKKEQMATHKASLTAENMVSAFLQADAQAGAQQQPSDASTSFVGASTSAGANAQAAAAPGPAGQLQQQQQQQLVVKAPPDVPVQPHAAPPTQVVHGGAWPTSLSTHSGLDPGVQATWGCAGVLVAAVQCWEEFSRSVPEREMGAVMQTLVMAFAQMAESVGLVMLEASGRTFSAATLHQHTLVQLNPLNAVALLQLAQGLMDAAAEVHLPPAYQPLPLKLVLHCGQLSTHAGVASGDALAMANELLASTPPLNITASTSMVERLTAAGMSHPLHALPTGVEEGLWVVEVHAAASQVAHTFQAASQAGSVDSPQLGAYIAHPMPIIANNNNSNNNNNNNNNNNLSSGSNFPQLSNSSGSAISLPNTANIQTTIGSNIPAIANAAPPPSMPDSLSSNIIQQHSASQPTAASSAPTLHTDSSAVSLPSMLNPSNPAQASATAGSNTQQQLLVASAKSAPDESAMQQINRAVYSAAPPAQPPVQFARNARASLGANPMAIAAGPGALQHPFRSSVDLQHGGSGMGASLNGMMVHPFRSSIDLQRGVGGVMSAAGPAPEFSGSGNSQAGSSRVSPAAAALAGGAGAYALSSGLPTPSFKRSLEGGQVSFNQGVGLSAEQQLMALRGELHAMRQQMDYLNAGEGRFADASNMVGMSPSTSRAQVMLGGSQDAPVSPQGGAAPGSSSRHAGRMLEPSTSMGSTSSSVTKKEKGSVSRFFSKMTSKSKK